MSIDIHDPNFITKLSPYHPTEVTLENLDTLKIILDDSNSFQFDCHCIYCDKETTFRKDNYYAKMVAPGNPGMQHFRFIEDNELNLLSFYDKYITPKTINFRCSRNGEHKYFFTFIVDEKQLIKIGQYPSIADIESNSIKVYRKILKSDYQYFSKAIGLYANGIGIGSYVYLRRIFENLISEARDEAAKDDNLDIKSFDQAKMKDKIKLLGNHYLPEFIVDNSLVYSILSKGIHELTEDDCKKIFPTLQVSIELILDDKIELARKKDKRKQAAMALNKFNSVNLNQENP